MFLKILEKIKEFDSIILHRHERPDGDCIGTQMGFYHLIKANFPNKCVYTTGDELPDYLVRYGHVDNVTDDNDEHPSKTEFPIVKLPDDLTAKQIAYDLTLKTVEVEDVINIKENEFSLT